MNNEHRSTLLQMIAEAIKSRSRELACAVLDEREHDIDLANVECSSLAEAAALVIRASKDDYSSNGDDADTAYCILEMIANEIILAASELVPGSSNTTGVVQSVLNLSILYMAWKNEVARLSM